MCIIFMVFVLGKVLPKPWKMLLFFLGHKVLNRLVFRSVNEMCGILIDQYQSKRIVYKDLKIFLNTVYFKTCDLYLFFSS